jgi:hypothetical protein
LTLILTVNVPLLVCFLIVALFTGPFTPSESLYWYPYGVPFPSAFHPGDDGLERPGGSVNVWVVEVAPLAITSTVAPLTIGSPTTVFGDSSSRPVTSILRSDGSTPGSGSFTLKDFPRIVWSAERAGKGLQPDSTTAATKADSNRAMPPPSAL